MAELSRLPAHPWCQGGHCTPLLHLLLWAAATTQWWVCACPVPPRAQSTGCWCGVCTVLMLLLAQRTPTTPPGCARPRSRHQHTFVCLSEGKGHGGDHLWDGQGRGTGCSWQQGAEEVEGAPGPSWVSARRPPKGARAAPWLACTRLRRIPSSRNSIRTVTSEPCGASY